MSESKIYVGNLSYDVTGDQLNEFFSKFGEISDVKLISDFETGRSKGFAFITYGSEDAVNAAIEGGNDVEFEGRKMKVNKAKDNRRTGGSGGGGGRGGRGDSRGSGGYGGGW